MRKADFDYYLARKLDSDLPTNEPSIILMKKQSKVCRNDFEIISSEFVCGEESYPKLVLFPWNDFLIMIED